MARRSNLRACGIYSPWETASFSQLESPTKNMASLASSLRTWRDRTHIAKEKGVLLRPTVNRTRSIPLRSDGSSYGKHAVFAILATIEFGSWFEFKLQNPISRRFGIENFSPAAGRL